MVGNLTMDVRGIPEIIWAARKEMAKLLRIEAKLEDIPAVKARLLALADVFETGVRSVSETPNMDDAAEMLWVVLANVSGGDWKQQTPEWQEAAAKWRDYYFAALGRS